MREPFLEQVVEALSRVLGADMAFVSRALGVPPNEVQVLAAWQYGARKEAWNFPLAGTPCDLIYDSSKAPLVGAVVHNGGQIVIPEGLCEKFEATRNTRFQSFIGVPLWNRQGDMTGHLAVFFEAPMRDEARIKLMLEIMQLLAHRVEGELVHMALEDELELANRELQRANAQLTKDSITDPLTQIANRRYFNHRSKEAFARYQRYGEHYHLLLFDVDFFKAVNDRYGHDVGDQVLLEIARSMSARLRADVEVLARLGGEEFAVLCHGVAQVADAAALAERICAEIAEQHFQIGAHAIQLTVSAGVSAPNPQDTSWEEAYRRADRALYLAKSEGRNRVGIIER